MNIQDIMLRDIADEERKRRERYERGADDDCGFPWLAVAILAAVALAALSAAFMGGVWYESRRAQKAGRDFAAWNERAEREAAERARAMSDYELLNATGRVRAVGADR